MATRVQDAKSAADPGQHTVLRDDRLGLHCSCALSSIHRLCASCSSAESQRQKFFAVEACIANIAVRSEDSQEVHEAEPLRDVPSLQAQPWLWETGVCSVAPILQSSSYGLVALEIPACHDRSRRSLVVVCGSRAPDPGGASADSRGSPDEASCSGASLG